jgi:transcriptional regulator GlxA family with amidase domain
MSSAPVHQLGFILLQRCSMATLGGMLGVIEAANEVASEQSLPAPFAVAMLQELANGEPVNQRTLADQLIASAGTREILERCDTLFVVSDAPLPETGYDALIEQLKKSARHGVRLGGIGTGAWLLARAGVLDGYRATIHWPYSALFAERFPLVLASGHLYSIDRQRLSCAGGQASLDMMLALIGEMFGGDTQADVLEQLGIERAREASERQRIPLTARIGGGQPKLTEAVSLMEANFEEPLPTEEIARLVGVSRRQLERLFKQHLSSLPSRYYLEMRLSRARQLLRETSQSILQIGLSCGFSSGPHFSSAYRSHFGVTPRDERSRRLQGLASAGSTPQASTRLTPSENS